MVTPPGNGPSSVEPTPLQPHTEFSPSVSSAFVSSGLKEMFLEGGDCHCFILRVLVTGMRWGHVDEDRRLSLGDLGRKTKGITGVQQPLCQ